MLLTRDRCLALCETPAAAADLAVGRALEARHTLHLDGEKHRLLQFLAEQKPELASPEAYDTLVKVATPATKPIYAGLVNLLANTFTAQGRNFYFQFTRPELSDDYAEYLKDKKRTGQPFFGFFRSMWMRAALTGFQGVFLMDLPTEQPLGADGLPRPYSTFIPSSSIWDIAMSGDRVEYLILKQEIKDEARYFCYDDLGCHRVLHKASQYTYLDAELTVHGLDYVPVCPVTTRQPDPLHPVRRTSAIAPSLEVATVYLRDYNMHEMAKAYHGYQKMWSYGVTCSHSERYSTEEEYPSLCNAGYIYGFDGVAKRPCSHCKGKGKVIPVGPDKVYVVEPAPEGMTSVVNPGPAGYIVPELESARYIGDELVKNEAKLEKSVLGKSGLLDQQKQDTLGGKILDWGPAYQRFADLAEDAEACLKFQLDTKARLRYGSDFQESAITLGRKYLAKSLDQMEAEYAAAKLAGLDDALLYSYLEDMTYTRWAGDPMELERNLLKLELTPFPTCTVAEAVADGIGTSDDLLLKRYINDFFDRFERENGSILDFASALSHAEKINRILETFAGYTAEKRPTAAVAPGSFAVGESVMVRSGMEHMPAHAGLSMTIAAVSGDSYAVKLPDGTTHKWYTGSEMMSMSGAPKPAKAPAMVM